MSTNTSNSRRGNGEATYRKRTINGKTYIEGRIMIDGRRYSVYAQKETDCRRKIDKIKFLGPNEKPDKITVSEWIEKWLENEIKPAKKISTYLNYKMAFKNYIEPDTDKIILAKYSRMDGQNLINKRAVSKTKTGRSGLSPSTVKRIYLIMSAAFSSAVEDGMIDKNPMDLIEIPEPQKTKIETINKKDFQKIIEYDAAGDPIIALSQLLLITGLRRGEGLGLKWIDIDFKKEAASIKRAVIRGDKELIVTTPKNNTSIREISLPARAIEILKNQKAAQNALKKDAKIIYRDQGFIFSNAEGGPLHPDAVRRGLHRLLSAVDVPLVSVHTLRHSYASIMFELGEEGKVIQSVLGHSSIKTTMDIYVRVTDGAKKEAADKINSFLSGSKEAKNQK